VRPTADGDLQAEHPGQHQKTDQRAELGRDETDNGLGAFLGHAMLKLSARS
jgi:hypothetical protein